MTNGVRITITLHSLSQKSLYAEGASNWGQSFYFYIWATSINTTKHVSFSLLILNWYTCNYSYKVYFHYRVNILVNVDILMEQNKDTEIISEVLNES